MLHYRSLEIRDTPANLNTIISNLKNTRGAFRYMAGKSGEYALNIFVDKNSAFCFKTDKKSLYGANVWMVRYNDILQVANITADILLDVETYNFILIQFCREVIEKAIIPGQTQVVLTEEEMKMADIMSKESYSCFNKWYSACNKTDLINHPSDEKLFIEFIYSLYEYDREEFDINLFSKLLQEKFPYIDDEKISDLVSKVEFGFDLFQFVDENK